MREYFRQKKIYRSKNIRIFVIFYFLSWNVGQAQAILRRESLILSIAETMMTFSHSDSFTEWCWLKRGYRDRKSYAECVIVRNSMLNFAENWKNFSLWTSTRLNQLSCGLNGKLLNVLNQEKETRRERKAWFSRDFSWSGLTNFGLFSRDYFSENDFESWLKWF